jgi:hypothetical protein
LAIAATEIIGSRNMALALAMSFASSALGLPAFRRRATAALSPAHVRWLMI